MAHVYDTVERAGLALATPGAYADEESLHQRLALLRREAPVRYAFGR